MKDFVLTFGLIFGVFQLGKGLVTIIGTELLFDLIGAFTNSFLDGWKPLKNAEKEIEDSILGHAIITASIGVTFIVAALCKDVLFFTTGFIAFNLTHLLLHIALISTGKITFGNSFLEIAELFVMAILTVYFFTSSQKKLKKV